MSQQPVSLLPFNNFYRFLTIDRRIRLNRAFEKSIQLCFEIIEHQGHEIPELDSILENFYSVRDSGVSIQYGWDQPISYPMWKVRFYLDRSINHLVSLRKLTTEDFNYERYFSDIIHAIWWLGYGSVVLKRKASPLTVSEFSDVTEAEAMIVHLIYDEITKP